MTPNAFAIDINQKHTRIANLQIKSNQIELLSLGYDDTVANFFSNPTDKTASDQAKLITNLSSQLKLSQQKVHVTIPDAVTYSQLMVMPRLSEEELVESIRLQADEFVPLPIEDVYIDLETISKLPNNALLVLFVAAPKKIVDHVANTLNQCGLEALSLENELSAVGRFIAETSSFITTPSLFINFGYTGSSLYILDPPKAYFEITRTTRIGLEILLKDLKVNLNFSDSQAIEMMQRIGLLSGQSANIYPVIYPIISELLNEIDKTLSLAKEKFNIQTKSIYFFNFDGSVAGLYGLVQNKFNIPVDTFPISKVLVQNSITQSFQNNLSSFVSVISTFLR